MIPNKKTATPLNRTGKRVALLKKRIVEWSLQSTFHCYPKVFQYDHGLVQFVWSAVFLCFSFLTLWLVSNGFIEYASFDVVSKTEIVNERPAEFPTVTVCNKNPFTTQAHEYLLRNLTRSYFGQNIEQMSFFDGIDVAAKITELAKMLYAASKKNEAPQYITSIVTNCYFNKKKCLDTDFSAYYSYEYGDCLQFNSNRSSLKKTNVDGQEYGLFLNLGPIPYKNKMNKYPTSSSNGAVVFLHNHSHMPSSSEGVYLELGKETKISVKRMFFKNSPSPYSDCVDMGATFRPRLYAEADLKTAYRQKDCIDLCLQQLIIAKCNCYYPKYPNTNKSSSQGWVMKKYKNSNISKNSH